MKAKQRLTLQWSGETPSAHFLPNSVVRDPRLFERRRAKHPCNFELERGDVFTSDGHGNKHDRWYEYTVHTFVRDDEYLCASDYPRIARCHDVGTGWVDFG